MGNEVNNPPNALFSDKVNALCDRMSFGAYSLYVDISNSGDVDFRESERERATSVLYREHSHGSNHPIHISAALMGKSVMNFNGYYSEYASDISTNARARFNR